MLNPQTGGRAPLATSAPAPYVLDGSTFAEPATTVDIRRVWKTFLRRRRLFLAVFAAFFAAVVIFTLLQPRKYTVSTKLIAGSSTGAEAATNPNTPFSILNTFLSASGGLSPETYAELLQETPVAQEVIDHLHLNIDPNSLLHAVFVKPVNNTAILNVSVTYKDPTTAAAIANELGNVFVRRERELVAGQANSAITALQAQIPDADAKLRSAQDVYTAYEQQTGISDLATQTTATIAKGEGIDTKIRDAQQNYAQATATIAALQGELGATPPTIESGHSIGPNPLANQLTQSVADLRVKLKSAQAEYTNDHPVVLQLRSQLAEAQRELASVPATQTSQVSNGPNPVYQQLQQALSSAQGQASAAQAAIGALQQQRAAAQPSLSALPEQSRRLTELQRAVKSKQDYFDALQSKLQEAELSRKSALSDIAVTSPATADNFSVTPNLALNALLGAVVGLALAISSVFLIEFFDDRLRTSEDVKDRLALPVLATIPMLAAGDPEPGGKPAPAGKLGSSDWIKPLSVESFYQLVASLRYSSNNPPRTIAFTSAQQGDGKSTVALNTAISMALMKARVLIVDADLRRPSVHVKLGIANERGLSDLLVGLADFSEVVKQSSHDGVWVVTSGRKVPNPVALLQSDAFDRFLQRSRERFDFVIIDGPALRSIIDGVVIGIKTDGTVLVVSAATTEGRAAATALAKLRSVPNVHVIGVVLNGTKPDPSEYSDYYLGGGQTMALPSQRASL